MIRLRRLAARITAAVLALETLAVAAFASLSLGAGLTWGTGPGLMVAGVLLLVAFVVIAAYGTEAKR